MGMSHVTKRTLIALAVAGIALFSASPTWAQDKQGAGTVIMKFEKLEADQKVMDTFYRTLNDQINQSDEMHIVSGGEATIEDMLLMTGAGCKTPKPQCLKPLASYVSGQRIVFGSIQRTENIYLFSMKMFDFVEERIVREVQQQTVEGDVETVEQAIPGIVEGFLYGDVGTVGIEVAGADDTTVKFDGQTMGPAPTTLKNMPLGQHAVTVETGDGKKQTKMVILRRGEPADLTFDFRPEGAETPKEGDQPPEPAPRAGISPVPGFISAGVGLVGVGVGLFSHFRLGKLDQEASQATCTLDGGSTAVCQSGRLSQGSPSAQQKAMNSSATMRIIGLSVGGVGIAAGSYLLFRAYSNNPESGAKQALDGVSITPRRKGVSVGWSTQF
jgi:hypothetical protein